MTMTTQPTKTARWFIPVLLLFGAVLAAPAQAQVPPTMSYQGLLTDTDGDPVDDGDYVLTFRFYDTDTGGAALWEETQEVTVEDGLFHATLGSTTPLALPFDQPYWLGMTVNGGDELVPRIALSSAAYSLTARTTLAEPENGQGFAVRDTNGGTAHLLRPDGSVMHAGDGYFAGSLVVGNADTTAAGKASRLPATGITGQGSETGVLGVTAGGSEGVLGYGPIGVRGLATENAGYGVIGESNEAGVGVWGSSIRGAGVRGQSDDSNGVVGASQNEAGVFGRSDKRSGVFGTGPLRGVEGISDEGTGIRGESSQGIGVEGSGGRVGISGFSSSGIGGEFFGDPASLFHGNVHIEEMLQIDLVEKDPTSVDVLVHSADNIVRKRSFSDLVGGASGWTDDGTTTRTTRKAVLTNEVDMGCTETLSPDGNCPGMPAVTVDEEGALVMHGNDGDEVFRVNPDGTSYHKGLEHFEEGIEVPGAEGGTIRLNGLGLSVPIHESFGGGRMTVSPFGLIMLDGEGETVFETLPDGTSFHAGLEEFAGGLAISGDGTITLADGTVIGSADDLSGFDGTLDKPLFIDADDDGNNEVEVTADEIKWNAPTIIALNSVHLLEDEPSSFTNGINVGCIRGYDAEGNCDGPRAATVGEDGLITITEIQFNDPTTGDPHCLRPACAGRGDADGLQRARPGSRRAGG